MEDDEREIMVPNQYESPAGPPVPPEILKEWEENKTFKDAEDETNLGYETPGAWEGEPLYTAAPAGPPVPPKIKDSWTRQWEQERDAEEIRKNQKEKADIERLFNSKERRRLFKEKGIKFGVTAREIDSLIDSGASDNYINSYIENKRRAVSRQSIRENLGTAKEAKDLILGKGGGTKVNIRGGGRGFGSPTSSSSMKLYGTPGGKGLYSSPGLVPSPSQQSQRPRLDLSGLRRSGPVSPQVNPMPKPISLMPRVGQKPIQSRPQIGPTNTTQVYTQLGQGTRLQSRPVPQELENFLQPGEQIKEPYDGETAFWIGSKQGAEYGKPGTSYITQMATGSYRLVGIGATTGKPRSLTIGKDPGNAASVVLKMVSKIKQGRNFHFRSL